MDFETTVPTPVEPTLSDIKAMLQAMQEQILQARKEREAEVREWSHWRQKMDAALYNLSERANELAHMYEQAIEVLPVAKRCEQNIEEIHAWMTQGGMTARRRG